MKNILIVEDNLSIGKLIKTNLDIYGYASEHALHAEDALTMLKNHTFDLILLDVMMPKISGFELLDMIDIKKTPVIMLTALDTVTDKVTGLKLGADDYITKPFESIELIARIEAVLRRYEKPEENIIESNGIWLDIHSHTVHKNGQLIRLTSKEYELLKYFMENPNKVLTREIIINKVWGYDFYGGTRTVDLHVKRIRTKADLYTQIKTIHRVGYIYKLGE